MKVFAEAERLRAEGVDVVDFGAGQPDFPTPDNIKQAAMRAITANFTRYTATGGTPELKEAICERHALDFGTSYTPPECHATVGGKHAIFNVTQVLIGAGDEVIVPVPYWVTYKDVVEYAGGKCALVETSERNGFALRAADVERRLTPKTRLIIINSPCNPSGAVLEPEEFGRICRLAASRGIHLLTDECYSRLVYDSAPFSAAALPGAKETVIVAGSLSKTYAMTGWRIGYVLAQPPLIDAVLKLQSHVTSNPASISQKAAVEAMRGPQDAVTAMLAEYRRRRDFVVARLRAIPGVTCAEPKGAFYAYPNMGVLNTADLAARLLANALVAVVPGEAFGTRGHIRISYATSMTELERGLDRIHKFMENNSPQRRRGHREVIKS